MNIALFVEQLESLAITILTDGLGDETISLERADELSKIILASLYPNMDKNHLLLARDTFLKVPELKPVAEEIDNRINEIK